VTARAVAVIAERCEPYSVRGTVITEDLRSATHANLAGMLAVLSEGRAVERSDLSVPMASGRRRAEQGVPLESVLHAFRLGAQELQGALVARARRRSAAELACYLEAAPVVFEVEDAFLGSVADGYRLAEDAVRHSGSLLRREDVDALLNGSAAASGTLAECAERLGLPAEGPYVVVVCGRDLSPRHATSARDACAAHGFPGAWRSLVRTEVGVIALGRAPVARLLECLRPAVAGPAGVSGVIDSLREVPEAYRLAGVAQRTATPRDPVAWLDDVLVEAVLAAHPGLAERLAARTLGPVLALRAADRDVLLETLQVWYDCDTSAALAAGRLYCHRNTVVKRLHRVEQLTGTSFDRLDGFVAGYLSLAALRLLGGPGDLRVRRASGKASTSGSAASEGAGRTAAAPNAPGASHPTWTERAWPRGSTR
jgi:hypothetical protein